MIEDEKEYMVTWSCDVNDDKYWTGPFDLAWAVSEAETAITNGALDVRVSKITHNCGLREVK